MAGSRVGETTRTNGPFRGKKGYRENSEIQGKRGKKRDRFRPRKKKGVQGEGNECWAQVVKKGTRE